jgi:uncharacterized repeat protein (TIGR01451 family)
VELKWASKAGSVLRRITAPRLLALAGVSLACALAQAATSSRPLPSRRQVLASYARLPLSFEPNLGQSDRQVKFLSRGHGYGLFLTADQAILLVQQAGSRGPEFRRLSLQLLHSNPAASAQAEGRLPGVSNYLLGDNSRQWHTGVPHFARIRYRGVYPGVDLVYYGRQRQLEYDFVAAPGSDPGSIRLQVRGAQSLALDRRGNLILQLPGGAIQLRRPQAYQQTAAGKRSVDARYVLRGGSVAIALGHYDRRRALVIDPRLAYFSYIGGSLNETSPAVAVDSAFNAYVAGTTVSADFPTLRPYQATLKGTSNIFISKFNSVGTGLYYSTYLGGSGTDVAAGVAVDGGFNAYVAGTTNSGDFPVTPSNAYQKTPKTANNHVFLTELNSSGNALVYSTYLSGSNADTASGVAVGPVNGTVFITGTTQSTDFAGITRPGTLTGSSEFFVVKLNTSFQGTSSLRYCTYLGGNTPISGAAITNGGGIAVDSSANAYITGGTNYKDMPVVNAYQATLKGTENAFVAKIAASGAQTPLFLTYLGGSGTDIGHGIAADSAGNAYVTGSTTSSDFPVVAATGSSIYQRGFAGTSDAFLTKVAAAGTSLIWSTFIGQSGDTAGLGIAVDSNQNTFVTGSTSGSVTTVNPTQAANGGGATDAFVGEFDISGTAQLVTYLGGSGDDRGTGIALDTNGNPYVAGDTTSGGLATAGAYQGALKGGSDAFVAHFTGVSNLTLAAAASPNPVGIGNATAFTFTITTPGPDNATGVVLTDTLPSNGTFKSVTASQGTCSAPAGNSLACGLGQLPVSTSATVTVNIAPLGAGPLSDTGTLTSSSMTGSISAGASASVNDFFVTVSPNLASAPAGQAATYTVTVGPVPAGAAFPNGVSLKCSGGLPTASTCNFSTNPVTPNVSPVTSSLTIATTALPPGATIGFLAPRSLRRMYAIVLPLGGMVFLGFSLGGDARRRKRLAALAVLLLLALVGLQLACSSSKSTPTLPPYTPKGTYNVTISAVSGTATRTTKLTMVVQ